MNEQAPETIIEMIVAEARELTNIDSTILERSKVGCYDLDSAEGRVIKSAVEAYSKDRPYHFVATITGVAGVKSYDLLTAIPTWSRTHQIEWVEYPLDGRRREDGLDKGSWEVRRNPVNGRYEILFFAEYPSETFGLHCNRPHTWDPLAATVADQTTISADEISTVVLIVAMRMCRNAQIFAARIKSEGGLKDSPINFGEIMTNLKTCSEDCLAEYTRIIAKEEPDEMGPVFADMDLPSPLGNRIIHPREYY